MNLPKLEVWTGCMFAGKTTALINRCNSFACMPETSVIVVRPHLDTRYAKKYITSHDGLKFDAQVINTRDIEQLPEVDILGIDEAQFFCKNVLDYLLTVPKKLVIAAGLDLDWKGEPFGEMPELMAKADSIHVLEAICKTCGAPARRSQLVYPPLDSNSNILVGGAETYQPSCVSCFEKWMESNNVRALPLKEFKGL